MLHYNTMCIAIKTNPDITHMHLLNNELMVYLPIFIASMCVLNVITIYLIHKELLFIGYIHVGAYDGMLMQFIPEKNLCPLYHLPFL